MPTKSRPENHFVRIFLSAYEKGVWNSSVLSFPDEHQDGGVDGLATRSDGAILALEHTVVEAFTGDIADQSEMVPMFAAIEDDRSLAVAGLWIQVFVPVGTLHLQKPSVREAVAKAIHRWLRDNRLSLPIGDSDHTCIVAGVRSGTDFAITLTLRVIVLAGDGKLHVRRQQIRDTLGDVIEKALMKKVPKLVATPATRRVLLLERRHMNLTPERIHDEIDNRRGLFPALKSVDQIWILETIFYETDFGGEYVRFELYESGALTASYDFDGTRLLTRYEDGFTEVIHRVDF